MRTQRDAEGHHDSEKDGAIRSVMAYDSTAGKRKGRKHHTDLLVPSNLLVAQLSVPARFEHSDHRAYAIPSYAKA